MPYSELIKDFRRIRDYMRGFFVYGFKSRTEYDAKSARSYDNERRRIESWLGGYMSFHRDANGKSVFISVDSRSIAHDPLFQAFKAKSFTDNDITLHFYLLDILRDDVELSVRELLDCISGDYLSHFTRSLDIDESTLRKKLKEYADLGVIAVKKRGRELVYRRAQDDLDLESLADALAFASEQCPVGVVGSYLSDRLVSPSDILRFKHHYILSTLDSEVMYELLVAMDEGRAVALTVHTRRRRTPVSRTVFPVKLYISTQTGRQYLLGCENGCKRPIFYRLDTIKTVSLCDEAFDKAQCLAEAAEFERHLWGVSSSRSGRTEHLEMTLRIEKDEEFIVQRLEREKRCGNVERLSPELCIFSADVYDAEELLPWVRTFIGRVVELKCSNADVVSRFYDDIRRLNEMYGGDDDAVS